MERSSIAISTVLILAILSFTPMSANAQGVQYPQEKQPPVHWVTGALVGLAVGAGAGVGIGYAACTNTRSGSGFCGNKAAGMTYLGIGMGGLGFGVGGVVNYYLTRDKPEASGASGRVFATEPWIDPVSGTYGLSAGMNF